MNQHSRQLAALAGLCLAACARAASPMENLVTTASRTALPPAQAGSSISVLDRDYLDQRQSLLLTDVLQDLPGLAVSRAGGPGQQSQLRVRGAEANQVLVFIDGVEANDPGGADEFAFAQLTAWDVERVEVVRGPQSALWGSDALAGVVNITTRRGDAARGGEALAEAGSFGTHELAARLGARRPRSSFDLSLSQLASDGINVAAVVDEQDGFTGTREDAFANTTASARAAWDLSPGLRLTLFGRYTDAGNDYDALGPAGIPVDADLRTELRQGLVHGRLDLDPPGGSWQHSLRIQYLDSDRENLAAGVTSDTQAGAKFGASYQASHDFLATPGVLRGTLAVDYDRESFSQRYLAFSGADQDQARDTLGYVAELLARPAPSLDLSASVRYDQHSDIRNQATWRVTGAYSLADTDSRLHASYGTGLKQPTFIELFGFFPAGFVGNPALRPETSRGFDAGLEQGLLDGRLRLDLTWFQAELDDEIQGTGLSVTNAPGTSRRRGLELALRADVTEQLRAVASYTLTDATEPDPDDPARGRRDEIRRPRHMAALNLAWRVPGDRLRMNLNLSHTGRQTDDIFAAPDYARQTVTLEAYTLVNLAASLQLGRGWTIHARAENLLAASYQEQFGYRAAGRAWAAGLRYRFGR